MVDSAATTAEAVEDELTRLGLLHPANDGAEENRERPDGAGRLRFLTTDAPERFARVGSLFLGARIDPAIMELVVL